MKRNFILFTLFITCVLVACKPNLPYQPSEDDDSSTTKQTYLQTGEYSDVTHNSVVLYAETNVKEERYDSIDYGFLYSADKEYIESRMGEVVWSENGVRDEENNVYTYYTTLTDLQPEQVYYYCAMVRLNGTDCKYGKIKEFTTKSSDNPSDPDNPDDPMSDLPKIESPGDGWVTIALRAPEGTCNGMVAVGAATNSDGSDDWDPSAQNKKFAKVDGTDNWYQITLPANYGIAVKVIAISSTGRADWTTQWGMNTVYDDPNVVILAGEGYLDNSENSGEVKLTELVENTVVYVDVLAWKSEPCISKNAAGLATFHVTVPYDTPSYAQVSVAGSFDENAWTPGAYLLTRLNDGTYYGEFYIPEAFEYKYIVGCDGLTWSWNYCEQISGNRVMPLDLYAIDVVDAWYMIPEDPNAGKYYESVDMGLSVKWATCNVGAEVPEGYGIHFSWGETQPKEYYSWSNYKWCEGNYNNLTKYNYDSNYGYIDDKTTLELEDDAAYANWGRGWRMPTDAEMKELFYYCTWTWIDLNGVGGFQVTSNINGNSIFLPAAGYHIYSYIDGYGCYATSSLSTNTPHMLNLLFFNSESIDYINGDRAYSYSIRPVCQ